MSFIPLNAEDFVVSSDSITSTLWSNNVTSLTAIYTSSTAINNNAYLQVYSEPTSNASALPQFSISYGQLQGSGSAPINASIPGLSPTRITYGQFRTLINGDENTNINFGAGNTNSPDFYVISLNRANYKEKLFPGTFNLALSGSDGTDNRLIRLTDNSVNTTTLTYCDAGRVFDIVSGSNGSAMTSITSGSSAAGYTVSGSYGKFLPDVGLILLNARALALSCSLGGIGLTPGTSNTSPTLGTINTNLFNAINSGKSFSLNSEETITSDYIFVRIKNNDFNYTTNPSMISGSGEFYYPSLINNPQTYITTVGLYNNNNELLGVAKLSKPLVKDFTKEALIRVKLDF